MKTRVLIPSGALALGFDAEALARGVAARPDLIAIDGGSTDSGPFYLGTGTSKYSRAATRAEWAALIAARHQAGVPLVLGSAGTCGTDASLDWMLAITREIAAERGERLRVATLHSQQPAGRVRAALAAGRVHPLDAAPQISAELIASCSNIVALAGAEQIGAALATGAEIVIAGRATDTAAIAALPLARGADPGAAWHGAKVAECGALCTTMPASGVIMVEFDAQGFSVEPMAAAARATPATVSAHMLYENVDPFVLTEPGGHLDVSAARYRAIDARRVRVEGSRWRAAERYTVKLEGARLAGHQSVILALLRDPRYVANIRDWARKLRARLARDVAGRLGLGPGDYAFEIRLIGVDATLGALESETGSPLEVGALGIVTAPSQARATEIALIANPLFLHLALREEEEMPTFAFPFSPAHMERGPLYEFCLNHVMELDEPMQAFRLEVVEVGR